MKLVIGGAYQGKLAYAQKQYQIQDGWIDGRDCGFEAIESCSGIHHFHDYVKRMLVGMTDDLVNESEKKYEQPGVQDSSGFDDNCVIKTCSEQASTDSPYQFRIDHLANMEQQAAKFVKRLSAQNPDIIIVSNELGCGVVPMDKKDRLWREAVGRICTCIAAEADEVVRVVCGVGVRIK